MMNQTETRTPLAINHISVDCVVLGWDGEKINVLLVRRNAEGADYNDMKLPGSLIYQDEDLDQAAARVLFELTGMENAGMTQYKAYGSKDRTRNPRDVVWLERAQKIRVERIVTIAYIALVKLDRAAKSCIQGHNAIWMPIDEVGTLAFDHNIILRDSLEQMRQISANEPAMLFDLLPKKFTLTQMRTLFEMVFDHKVDVRNFHKKVTAMAYVMPLDEYQQGVAHRAARFYRFDRKTYNRHRH